MAIGLVRVGFKWVTPLMIALLALPLGAEVAGERIYADLRGKVQVQLESLKELIAKADEKGVETSYAKVSVETIRAFQKASDWDHTNIEEVRRIYKTFNHYSKTDPTCADRLAFNELEACLEVADYAKKQLVSQMFGQQTLPPTPDFSKGKVELTPGSYRLDGRRVFPYTLFWLPTINEGMGDAFGRMGHAYMAVGFLNDQGKVIPSRLDGELADAREQSEHNFTPLKFFWGHIAAPWMKGQPQLLLGGRNFTEYNIDSPKIRELMVQLCEQFVPAMAEAYGDKPMIYMIANEPHFATAKGGWRVNNGIGAETNELYRKWLAVKYGTVEKMNVEYGTAHTDFASVPSPFPIDPALRGGPIWYDWCRFNMDRVNDWFAFLKTTVQSNDNGRKEPVTIKVLGHHFSDGSRDHGMDIEFLTKLQDVTGGDLRVRPYDATVYTHLEGGLAASESWTERYAYEWISQALFLDFAKSLAPEKPFYDTEWHGFGAVHWRRFNLPRNYVRAGIWHAFTHGMGAIEPWMWGRKPDGSFRESADQIGELATQPVALDAYGRVMKELNAYADLVAAAVPTKRTFMFYYLEESAIQDKEYAHHLESSYEAVKLLNYPTGMTTPTHLATLDPAEQVVIVPPSKFVSDASLHALEKFQNAGGSVVFVDPTGCFIKDEFGKDRDAHRIESVTVVEKGEVFEMADHFDAILKPFAPASAVHVTFEDVNGKKAYGVLLQQVVHPETGELHLVLNNSSRDARKVVIDTNDSNGVLTDLLTGERLEPSFVLDSCDVKLIHIGSSS